MHSFCAHIFPQEKTGGGGRKGWRESKWRGVRKTDNRMRVKVAERIETRPIWKIKKMIFELLVF